MALKLWSKLEDADDVTSPQMGIGGAEIGSPTYALAKFGNGILCDDGAKGCTFPTVANSISGLKGTIEFWAKMLYASSNGAPNYADLLYCVGDRWIRLYWLKDFKRLIFVAGTGYSVEANGLTWALDELVHFAVTWDGEGNDIGSGKTMALFVNDVEVASSTTTWTTGSLHADLKIGYRSTSYYAMAIIDNLKCHDAVKIDFSDRFDESAGGNFAPTVPSSLLCEGETEPSAVTDLTPEFSAVYEDPDIGDQANALQIQVGTTPADNDMWDSGWMADLTQEGQRCPDQVYLGLPLLLQGTRYYWRIRFRDDDDVEGAWSANAEFTMYESLVPVAPTDLEIIAPLCFAARFNDPDSASSSAFEVHVSSSLDLLDTPDIWDSGWQTENTIEGDLCTPHLFAGSPLTFEEKYYWKIRFKDEGGNAGLWSHPRWFIFKESD